jgi:hypothetical protein
VLCARRARQRDQTIYPQHDNSTVRSDDMMSAQGRCQSCCGTHDVLVLLFPLSVELGWGELLGLSPPSIAGMKSVSVIEMREAVVRYFQKSHVFLHSTADDQRLCVPCIATPHKWLVSLVWSLLHGKASYRSAQGAVDRFGRCRRAGFRCAGVDLAPREHNNNQPHERNRDAWSAGFFCGRTCAAVVGRVPFSQGNGGRAGPCFRLWRGITSGLRRGSLPVAGNGSLLQGCGRQVSVLLRLLRTTGERPAGVSGFGAYEGGP